LNAISSTHSAAVFVTSAEGPNINYSGRMLGCSIVVTAAARDTKGFTLWSHRKKGSPENSVAPKA
jgi:hypothetical protein